MANKSRTRFTRLALENWRNFRNVDVEFGSRAFIVGPNASGKTNLLDALRFLSDVARREGSLAGAVSSRGGIAHLRSLHARQASHVRIEATLLIGADSWTYELVLAGTKTRPVHVERERVVKNGEELVPPRPNPEDLRDPRLLEQTHLEQLSQNSRFRELVDALASVSHVHIVPQVAKSSARPDLLLLRDAPGSDFIGQLAELNEKGQRGALNRIEKLLRIAVPHFSELRVEHDKKTGVPHLIAKYEHWRPQGSWQNEAEFSDGTIRLIGFIWAVMRGVAPLLLEEPELSLHRDVVRQIPRILARAAVMHGRQVLVTTHSEEILNDAGIDPSEIILLTPTNEDTRVTSGK
ncbi:MAG TPA: AAA family ATPase, partial [Anaeromyxobacteraceae bacterium]|nr:AAA family ATPase [Anaeromyxobacteraceae bacterium]